MSTVGDTLALGLQLHRAGRLAQAEAMYRRVLEAEPENADALHLFGVLAQQAGRPDVAVEAIGLAIRHQPGRADFHNNFGEACRALGLHEDAIGHYREALALKPGYADAHNNLGLALQETGRLTEAAAEYKSALAHDPDLAEAHNNLGNLAQASHQPDQAATHYRRALALRPAFPEAHTNLANVLKEQGAREAAEAHFEKALALRPDYAAARFGLCMAQVPVIARDEAEIDERRAAYERHLRALGGYLASDATDPVRAAEAVGSNQPFFLAYQGRNDRALQALYGAMIAGAMARRYPGIPALPAPAAGERIRVGFVSGWFANHSVWKLPLKGWVTRLDRRRFEVLCYHTRGHRDAETEVAERAADRFVQGPLSLDGWRAAILADAPHALIYPEIGMDPVTAQLAAQRLARVQCAGLGHPETSGLPTIDYFLSSDLMEPADGDDHYTETLIRLPNLSFCYDPLPPPTGTAGRAALGLPADAVLYWCCQSLFKYLPRHDAVFPRIAREVGPGCRFVFIGHQSGGVVAEVFRRRLEAAFAVEGLTASDYCVFLPRLDPTGFLEVAAACDIFLDGIGWSGNNSTLESTLFDLPVVTLAGDLMRGRHTAAILTMMGIPDAVTETVEAYTALAVRLGVDPTYRADMRRRVGEGRGRVYRDRDCVTALEAFLERAVGGPG